MSGPEKISAFVKFGIKDAKGEVLVAPTFDDAVCNEYFALGKLGNIWGNIFNFGENGHFSGDTFEDVHVFGDVLWFKKYGRWGAKSANGDVLVEPEYTYICVRDDHPLIIEAVNFKGNTKYFTVKGAQQIGQDIINLEIGDFRLGYALATGYSKNACLLQHYIIRAEDFTILEHSFVYARDAIQMLESLRNDYVWSMGSRK